MSYETYVFRKEIEKVDIGLQDLKMSESAFVPSFCVLTRSSETFQSFLIGSKGFRTMP